MGCCNGGDRQDVEFSVIEMCSKVTAVKTSHTVACNIIPELVHFPPELFTTHLSSAPIGRDRLRKSSLRGLLLCPGGY